MNIEKIVYDNVKNNPVIKDSLKLLYQGFFSLFGKKREWGKENLIIRTNSFFGFHDKSPWSTNNEFLLGHEYKGIGNENLSINNPVKISVFKGKNWCESLEIGNSHAWNWQQGAQLQWIGDTNSLIYNDFVDGECRAIEKSHLGDKTIIHKYPIAAVSMDSNLFASICFNTLEKAMPGYGYDFTTIKNFSSVEPDTLLFFNKQGVVLEKLVGTSLPNSNLDKVNNGITFISHVNFSPNGKYVSFLRRVSKPGKRLRSEMYIYRVNSHESVFKLPFLDMVSHYCWRGNNRIFAYANSSEGDGYFEYNIDSDSLKNLSSLFGNYDGHPHSDKDGNTLVVDTYPNKFRIQRLRVKSLKNNLPTEIANLYSPLKFRGDKRIDLHPRISQDGRYVSVDCCSNGIRSLATIDLNSLNLS